MRGKGDGGGDKARRRVYGGLLAFAVCAGVLLCGLPQLRERLVGRSRLLKGALAGDARPEILPMGEDELPYPEEFAIPDPPPVQPAPRGASLRPSREPDRPADEAGQVGAGARRRLTVPSPAAGAAHDGGGAPGDADLGQAPRFQQGAKEREAYDKVLAANPKLADMVAGLDAGLRFKTWAAAHRGGELYWVRVTFAGADGKDVEYIWRVDAAGTVAPLSFNARSL
ncbi:MAG: hypothetical protein LBT74_05525 [Acidobacteriota bacterium]|jgi:hypothetical protein|nr:hypothetical protein [Acidobacteriota bacterium]